MRNLGVTLVLWLCAGVSLADDVEWWQKGPIYQVYPASFADSNGDGWGDLKGILEHADYFAEIGVGAVWLSPIFTSPMKDNGYDVSDYTGVNPRFGTIDDVKALIEKLHSLKIAFLLDFVPNHSSEEHEWFKKSIKREAGYEDFYVWKDKKGAFTNGTAMWPNNWRSLFTEHAWTWNADRKQFYLHQFGDFQPDLNFTNPKVVTAMQDVMRFWLRLGVDGLRVDATPYLIETHYDSDQDVRKDCTINRPTDFYECQYHNYTRDQPELYTIIAKFAQVLDEFKGNGTRYQFVEAYADIENTMKYYMNNTSPFNFNILSYIHVDTDANVAKNAVDLWMNNMPNGSWPNWVTGNHDNSRVATRFGEEMVDAINTLSILLPGTPITYMGEELGMSDSYVPENRHQDKSDFNRDAERAPMQWNNSLNAGFSSNSTPYLPVNANYWRINVKTELTEDRSHLSVYKKLVGLHKDIVSKGLQDFKTYVVTPFVFGFTRPDHLVLINFNNQLEKFSLANFTLPNGKNLPGTITAKIVSLNSEHKEGDNVAIKDEITMRPRSAVVFAMKGASAVAQVSAPLILVSLIFSLMKR